MKVVLQRARCTLRQCAGERKPKKRKLQQTHHHVARSTRKRKRAKKTRRRQSKRNDKKTSFFFRFFFSLRFIRAKARKKQTKCLLSPPLPSPEALSRRSPRYALARASLIHGLFGVTVTAILVDEREREKTKAKAPSCKFRRCTVFFSPPSFFFLFLSFPRRRHLLCPFFLNLPIASFVTCTCETSNHRKKK